MAPTARPPPATAEDAVSHVCSYLQDFFFFFNVLRLSEDLTSVSPGLLHVFRRLQQPKPPFWKCIWLELHAPRRGSRGPGRAAGPAPRFPRVARPWVQMRAGDGGARRGPCVTLPRPRPRAHHSPCRTHAVGPTISTSNFQVTLGTKMDKGNLFNGIRMQERNTNKNISNGKQKVTGINQSP